MTTRANPIGTRGYDRIYNNKDRYETVCILRIRPYDMVMAADGRLSVVRCIRWLRGDVVLDFTDGTSDPAVPMDVAIRRMIYTM